MEHKIYVPIETILEGLTACICCDEPDGEKYRRETRYWLEQLADAIRRGEGVPDDQR